MVFVIGNTVLMRCVRTRGLVEDATQEPTCVVCEIQLAYPFLKINSL